MGYACRRADLDQELAVIEIIPAGFTPTKKIIACQCSKIMTGAQVPEGADQEALNLALGNKPKSGTYNKSGEFYNIGG